MRTGIRIALDLGTTRIGVAKCDRDGILASPVAVWHPEELQIQLAALVSEYEPIEILIGLPIDLRGEAGIAAQKVQEQAQVLATNNPDIAFRLVDERMTTRVARGQLRENGHTTRTDKNLIDAIAASVLLEDALAFERINGKAPGQVLG
jgi:putative Holliday junction resolvase